MTDLHCHLLFNVDDGSKSIDESTQTIITSVDTLLFDKEFLDGVEIFNIDNGNIMLK